MTHTVDTNDTMGLGNTKPNPRKRKWCLTLNNWTEDEYQSLRKALDTETRTFWILGKEIGSVQLTQHIQGYIEYPNARSLSSMKKLCPRAHWEHAKGNREQNFNYCSKDGNYETNIKLSNPDIIKKAILNDEYDNVQWFPYQQDILNLLNEKPDRRKIHWFWEPTGNSGKSYLAKYLALTRNVIICDGKKDNIFNQIKSAIDNNLEIKILLLDVPRTNNDYVNYGAIEQIKNGCIYSGKYEGGQCIFKIPHVLIFSNEEPKMSALSSDRWDIHRISLTPPGV